MSWFLFVTLLWSNSLRLKKGSFFRYYPEFCGILCFADGLPEKVFFCQEESFEEELIQFVKNLWWWVRRIFSEWLWLRNEWSPFFFSETESFVPRLFHLFFGFSKFPFCFCQLCFKWGNVGNCLALQDVGLSCFVAEEGEVNRPDSSVPSWVEFLNAGEFPFEPWDGYVVLEDARWFVENYLPYLQ